MLTDGIVWAEVLPTARLMKNSKIIEFFTRRSGLKFR